MRKIVKLPVKTIKKRICPKCGFVTAQSKITEARTDLPCPDCLSTTTRDFLPLRK